jgi:hypothetical protein
VSRKKNDSSKKQKELKKDLDNIEKKQNILKKETDCQRSRPYSKRNRETEEIYLGAHGRRALEDASICRGGIIAPLDEVSFSSLKMVYLKVHYK